MSSSHSQTNTAADDWHVRVTEVNGVLLPPCIVTRNVIPTSMDRRPGSGQDVPVFYGNAAFILP